MMHVRVMIVGIVAMAILHGILLSLPAGAPESERRAGFVAEAPRPADGRQEQSGAPTASASAETKRPQNGPADPAPENMVAARGRKPAGHGPSAASRDGASVPALHIDWGDSPRLAAEVLRRGGMTLVLLQERSNGSRRISRVEWDGRERVSVQPFGADGSSYSNRVRRVERVKVFAGVWQKLAANDRPGAPGGGLAILMPRELERRIVTEQEAAASRYGVTMGGVRNMRGKFVIRNGEVAFQVTELEMRDRGREES